MAFKMMGWSPFTQKNEGEKLSDQEFDAMYEEFKVNYDNAKTEEEKIALRKSFNEKTSIHNREGFLER